MCLTLPHCLGAAGWLRRNLWMEQKLLLSLEATEPGHGKCHGSRGAKGVLGYPSFQAAVWIICLSCTLCYQCCSWYHLLSYLIAVSKKFFLPQPVIFKFGALFSSPSCLSGKENGAGQGEVSKQCMVCSVLVGILNWGIPFLNYKRKIDTLQKRERGGGVF